MRPWRNALLTDDSPESERAEPLFVHLREAGRLEESIAWGRRAVDAAKARGALERAAEILRELLVLRGPRDAGAVALWSELAEVLADDERADDAITALEEAEAHVEDAETRSRLRARRGVELCGRGDVADGLALMGPALRPFGFRIPRTTLGTVSRVYALLVRATVMLWWRARRPRAPQTTPDWATSLLFRAGIAVLHVDTERGGLILSEAALRGLRAGDAEQRVRARLTLGFVRKAMHVGRAPYQAARAEVSDALSNASPPHSDVGAVARRPGGYRARTAGGVP